MKIFKISITLTFFFLTGIMSLRCDGQNSAVINMGGNGMNGTIPLGAHIARESITIEPTMNGQVSSGSVINLTIDKSLQLTATYQNAGATSGTYSPADPIDYYPIDKNLILGTIAGNASVSPYGSANYVIPVIVPPGSNGVAPQISISYSSSAIDGLLGRGWNISGISSIRLVPKTMYWDGIKEGILLRGTDEFELDGNRISSSGGNNYSAVNEPYSKIIATGPIGTLGTYFTVLTKEGVTMEYGANADSRLDVNGFNNSPPYTTQVQRTLVWYLNKTTDSHGNTIRYTYNNDQGEVTLKEISFTENLNTNPVIQPYNFVRFYYNKRKDSHSSFLLGNELKSTLIVREIEVFCENRSIKRFKFNYVFEGQSFLREVIEYVENKRLNSTFFKYGDDQPIDNSFRDNNHIMASNLPSNAKYVFGDFNGDGKADIAAFNWGNNLVGYTGMDLYLNNDNGKTYTKLANAISIPGIPNGDLFSGGIYPFYDQDPHYGTGPDRLPIASGIASADFDGDGLEDLIIGDAHDDDFNSPLFGYQGKTFVVCYSNGSGFEAGTTFHTHTFTELVLADITGDGLPEAISYGTSDNSHLVPVEFHFNIFELNNRIPYTLHPNGHILPYDYTFSGLTFNSITPIDFEGDGISEFLASRNETGNVKKNYVLKFGLDGVPQISNGTGQVEPINAYSILVIYNENDIFELYNDIDNTHFQYLYGDFNGDEITDNVRIGIWTGNNTPPNYKRPQQVEIRFGTGRGFTSYQTLNGTAVPGLVEYFVVDINKNNKADLLVMEPYSGNNVKFRVYYDGDLNPTPLIRSDFNEHTASNFYPRTDLTVNPAYILSIYSPVTAAEFSFGDLDGDGFPDLIYNCVPGQRCMTSFDQSFSQNNLTSIINGHGVKTDFRYSTIATNRGSFYIKGSTLRGFPLNNYQGAIYVVKDMIRPDGQGDITFNSNLDNTTITSYHYEDAVIHREGRGFIGFSKVTSVTGNDHAVKKIVNVNEYDFNPVIFETFKKRDATYIEQAGFSTAPYQYLYEENTYTLNSNFALPFKYSDINIIDRYGNHINKHFDYNSNGILTHTVTNLNKGFEIIDVSTPVEDSPSGTWLAWKPKERTKVVTRNQQASFTEKTSYEYDPIFGDLLKTKKFPTKDNEVDLENEYYSTSGCIKKTTVSTPLLIDPLPMKVTNFSYDDKFRFVVSASSSVQGSIQTVETEYNNVLGVPIWQKGVDGLISQFSYDKLARLTKKVNPDNTESYIVYDWLRNGDIDGTEPLTVSALYSVTEYSTQSPTTKVLYNAQNKEVKTQTEGFHKNQGTSNKIFTVKQYDGWGWLSEDAGPYDLTSLSPRTYLSNTYEYDEGARDWGELTNLIRSDGGANPHSFHRTFTLSNTNLSIEIITPDNKVRTETYDATGLLTAAQDAGGDIEYEYNSNHKLIRTKLTSTGMETTMEYDEYGRQTLLKEKNLGINLFEYNAYGLLAKQTDANAKWYKMEYDELDRLKKIEGIEGNYLYSYYTSGNGINQIKEITSPVNGNKQTFEYGDYGRLVKKEEMIDGISFSPSILTYTPNGLIDKYTYPNGFAVSYNYNNWGYLTQINRADNGNTDMIWKADEVNPLGQFTKYLLGNNILSEKKYTKYGLLQEIKSGGILDLKFDFDEYSGNLMQRQSIVPGSTTLSEDFQYDLGIDRLKSAQVLGQPGIDLVYLANGNIDTKTDVGTYEYNSSHPNAVSGFANQNFITSSFQQDITYTNFGKVNTIEEANYKLEYLYGPDLQRKRSKLGVDLSDQQQYSIARDRFYLDNYEITEDKTTGVTHTAEVNYINAPSGLVAMFVKEDNNAGNMHYVYSDHLGSILKLTDGQGNTTAEQSFDAWGNHRNPLDWSQISRSDWLASLSIAGGSGTGLPFWLNRGYTGHEHLDEFQLINMNGRMYDPGIASMLSPDPFVQEPTNTQNFNRYNYVMNNPLKYIDPEGYQIQDYGPDIDVGDPNHKKITYYDDGPYQYCLDCLPMDNNGSPWPSDQNLTNLDHSSPGSPSKDEVNDFYHPNYSKQTPVPRSDNSNKTAQGGGGVKSDPLIPGIYDNSLDNFVYQLSNLDRALDGHYNGTGLPPAPLRVAFSFFPPISVVNAGKTITTGKDLYNRNANSFLERGVLAPFNLVSPFAPTKIQNTIPFKMLDRFDKSKTIYDELWQE